jgi:hypothetical protein
VQSVRCRRLRLNSWLFALAAWSLLSGCAHAQSTQLQPPPTAIKVFQSLKPNSVPSSRCLTNYRVRDNPVYVRHDLLVLEPMTQIKDADTLLARCLGDIWAPAPLQQTGKTWQATTSQLQVRFDASLGLAGARAILARHDLTIRDATLFERAHIITADSGRRPDQSPKLAIAVAASPGVVYAEPSVVLIVK